MHNQEIAWALAEMADLMEILGENPFKCRAFRRGGVIVANLETPAATLLARDQLGKINGIGKSLSAEIAELLRDRETRQQRALREKVPPGVTEMLRLPGIGVRTVRAFFGQGLTTLEELEEAARERKIRQMPGLGVKTEFAVLRGLELLRHRAGKFAIGVTKPLAESFVVFLRQLPEVRRAEITGDLRRSQELVTEIRLLAASNQPAVVLDLVKKHPAAACFLAAGPDWVRFRVNFGLAVQIEVVIEEQFIPRLVETTGPPAHWTALAAYRAGRRCDGGPWQRFMPVKEAEEQFYRSLGLPWIPPELREDGSEIQLAAAGKLPAVVEMADIRGDLHLHTNWSDGVSTLEEMVTAAKEYGYEYMAITDHSQSLGIARGLSEAKLREQQRLIRGMAGRNGDFEILSGVEMDILTDARLDYPDAFLAEMDLVIASVHTGLRQPRERIHNRLEAALKNPLVDILGHPTGRMLGSREPYDVDVEWLLQLAAKTGTVLEINSSPDRLDLSAPHARQARDCGVMLVINTDAHDRARLNEIAYGVANARKAGLIPKDILNTRSAGEVKKILRRRKG
ncbi:MAG: DNA polymerase/3'-5' exonuclease PolX [Heliobacteriaceae bacterium]|nr:DNA polymerase/3'-5' exonuclease PolX [Heliobacteriaceae bacterium]MDD4587563.1 DNA polymerase/3'-5' exonuclease PolX [Heliobacteriaceae bacterium]